MTITTTTNRVSYAGNGVTTAFSFPYKFRNATDIKVLSVSDATSEETELTYSTQYTVAGAGIDAGGTVTITTAPASGVTIWIYRDTPLTQSTVLTNNDPFPSESVTAKFDDIYMSLQRLDDRVDRCLKLPDHSTGVSPDIELPLADGNVIAVNSDEDGFAFVAPTDPGTLTVSAFVETLLDDASAAAARTTLDAQRATNSLTAETGPAMDDSVPIYDLSATADRKMTVANLRKSVLAVAKTTTYVVTATDDFIPVDATGGAFTVTLPTAVGIAGRSYTFKKTDSTFSLVTIEGDGTETIDGALNTTVATQYETVEVVSDGTNWHIVRRYIPSVSTAYTPTGSWSTNSTYVGFWKRVGGAVEVDAKVTVSGVPTAAALTVNLPSGLVIDTALMTGATADTNAFGVCDVLDAGTATFPGIIFYNDTTSVKVRTYRADTTNLTTQNVTEALPMTWASPDSVRMKFRVPIVGWKG